MAVFGLHQRNDISEYALKNSYKLAHIQIHSSYNQTTSENDIALLSLNRNVQLSENISIICLPNANTNIVQHLNANAVLTGWGQSNNSTNTDLQQTLISLVNNDDKKCKNYLKNIKYKESVLCAINSEFHSNACSGDSGRIF